MSQPCLVAMTGVTKRYGGVLACDGVDLTIQAGEVHALLGENGAGKSTLMKVLSGDISDYSGSVSIHGNAVRFAKPADAQQAGIAMIHQELDLVPALSVADNLYLGREKRTKWGTVDRRAMAQRTRELLERTGMELDPNRPVGQLRVGEQQLVTIARALLFEAEVLIMDEPTSALSNTEVERLFSVITELRQRGTGIVYISHRMDEIGQIADRATVLRNGQKVAEFDARDMTAEQAAQAMVGRDVNELFNVTSSEDSVEEISADESVDAAGASQSSDLPATTVERAEDSSDSGQQSDAEVGVASDARSAPDFSHAADLLHLENFAVTPRRPQVGRREPSGITLRVRPGEIVGLCGLLGSGRTELLETLFGAGTSGSWSGTAELAGQNFKLRSPRQALKEGIAFVPEDRRASGLVLEHSVLANTVLSIVNGTGARKIGLGGFVRKREEIQSTAESVKQLKVKLSRLSVPVGTLSGGNQQKVVFGRMLLTEPKLLLLDDPTRGVDIGAKAEIYQLLREIADQGIGVLLASSELPELVGVCDRVVVLRAGRSVAEFDTATTTEADLLAAAMGEGHGGAGTNGAGGAGSAAGGATGQGGESAVTATAGLGGDAR